MTSSFKNCNGKSSKLLIFDKPTNENFTKIKLRLFGENWDVEISRVNIGLCHIFHTGSQ